MRKAFTSLPTRPAYAARFITGNTHRLGSYQQVLPLAERLQCELGEVNVEEFRVRAFLPERPLHITKRIPENDPIMTEHQGSHGKPCSWLPAIGKWFETLSNDDASTLNQKYLSSFSNTFLPYELSKDLSFLTENDHGYHTPMQKLIIGLRDINPGSTFHSFNAPLSLILEASETYNKCNLDVEAHKLQWGKCDSGNEPYSPCRVPSWELMWNRDENGNELGGDALIAAKAALKSRVGNWDQLRQGLYIAQAQILDLPQQLQEDLPTPELVKHAGKGDIYDANIWMGIPPTYTPLHKDPNPNLFVQLAGTKRVRLFKPRTGAAIFRGVQSQVGQFSSATFRGEEMMAGPERVALEQAVWGEESKELDGLEVLVGTGDALFIPKGWWHSIKSFHDPQVFVSVGISASVNWWFR